MKEVTELRTKINNANIMQEELEKTLAERENKVSDLTTDLTVWFV